MRILAFALLFASIAVIDAIGVISLEGGRIEFKANDTFVLLNNNFTSDYRSCLQYRAFVEGKRSKLNAYLCHMVVGGRCSSAAIRETNGKTQCHSLKPWMKTNDPYAVYFAFTRRPRHWHEHDDHDRLFFRQKRHSKSTRTVGILEIDGIVDCLRACQDEEGSGSGTLKV
uniref:Secreted protein n=1 Tax=Plectus sambesii TaxID=2011161 RepID=A0A914W5J8_9BILA